MSVLSIVAKSFTPLVLLGVFSLGFICSFSFLSLNGIQHSGIYRDNTEAIAPTPPLEDSGVQHASVAKSEPETSHAATVAAPVATESTTNTVVSPSGEKEAPSESPAKLTTQPLPENQITSKPRNTRRSPSTKPSEFLLKLLNL